VLNVERLISNQGNLGASLDNTLRDQLNDLRKELSSQQEKALQKISENAQETADLLPKLRSKEEETQKLSVQLEQSEKLANERFERIMQLSEAVKSLQGDLEEARKPPHELERLQLAVSDRDQKLQDLERQLSAARSERQAIEIQLQTELQVADETSKERENQQSFLSTSFGTIRNEILTALDTRQKEVEQTLKQSEMSTLSLQEQIRMFTEQLKPGAQDGQVQKMKRDLQDAKQRIVNLTDKLRKSDSKSRDIREWLKHWTSTRTEEMDYIKAQLDSLSTQFVDIQNIEEKFDTMLDVQRRIHDTNKLWVTKTVESEEGCKHNNDTVLAGGKGKTHPNQDVVDIFPTQDESFQGVVNAIGITNNASTGNEDPNMSEALTGLELERHVVLRSPTGEELGSSPLSVEGEQERRRNALPPMGIMKLTNNMDRSEAQAVASCVPPASALTKQVAVAASQLRKGTKAADMYNRTVSGRVMGALDSTPGEMDAKIEVVKSQFLNSASMKKEEPSLTTPAQWQSLAAQQSKQNGLKRSRPLATAIEEPSPSPKKAKVTTQAAVETGLGFTASREATSQPVGPVSYQPGRKLCRSTTIIQKTYSKRPVQT
jgi:predicted  nucleic acid-binding Zn-ribbon protein